MKKSGSFQVRQLKNGIRLLHKNTSSEVTHLGLIINAGSRDERDNEQGLAHFIEHVIFKGTTKRKSFQIFNRIENVGGDLNAFTTKEETCIHASFTNEHLERAAELLSDIFFNSVFPVKELEKEKDIVIDEINYYKDIPDELIVDEFEEKVFSGHQLGRSVLGRPEQIKGFSPANIRSFMNRNYHPEDMVISIAGKNALSVSEQIAARYFDREFNQQKMKTKRKAFKSYTPSNSIIEKNTFQKHCIVGNVAYAHHDPKRLGLILLNNLLGGPASNSRLNMLVREKFGLTYNIESSYLPFSDTGLFYIYFSADNGAADKAAALISGELKNLRNNKLGTMQLGRAKSQIRGQVALSVESNLSEMLTGGKSLLVYNKIDTIPEIFRKIDALTAEGLLEIANEVFDESKFSSLMYLSK